PAYSVLGTQYSVLHRASRRAAAFARTDRAHATQSEPCPGSACRALSGYAPSARTVPAPRRDPGGPKSSLRDGNLVADRRACARMDRVLKAARPQGPRAPVRQDDDPRSTGEPERVAL